MVEFSVVERLTENSMVEWLEETRSRGHYCPNTFNHKIRRFTRFYNLYGTTTPSYTNSIDNVQVLQSFTNTNVIVTKRHDTEYCKLIDGRKKTDKVTRTFNKISWRINLWFWPKEILLNQILLQWPESKGKWHKEFLCNSKTLSLTNRS